MTLSYQTDPFPHIIGSLPEEFYQEIKKSWNDIVHENHMLNFGNRSNIELVDEQIKLKFNNILLNANIDFSKDLLSYYPKLIDHELRLDSRVLYSENKATDYAYKIRGLHLDTGDKILVGLWYFKDDNESESYGGDLILYNPLTKQSKKIDYGSNVFVLFPNLPVSWHSVTPRLPCEHPRRYINLLLESENTILHNYKRPPGNVDSEFRGKFINYYK